jgi:outer membrane protein
MKKAFRTIFTVTVMALLFAMPAMAQSRIATIDLGKVFNNYWKRQQAQAALTDRGHDLEKQMKDLMTDYKKLQDDYNKLLASANDQSVTPEERDKRKAAAEAKLQDIKSSETNIRAFQDDATAKIDSQKKRMRDSILEDIRTAVTAKAKAANYSMVIDTASDNMNETPVVLYSNGENDLTTAILTQLNATAPPSSDTSGTNKPADKP